jgi:hypothetical protein
MPGSDGVLDQAVVDEMQDPGFGNQACRQLVE